MQQRCLPTSFLPLVSEMPMNILTFGLTVRDTEKAILICGIDTTRRMVVATLQAIHRHASILFDNSCKMLPSRSFCDVPDCHKKVRNEDAFYISCDECKMGRDGIFVLCHSCCGSGARCSDRTHHLVQVAHRGDLFGKRSLTSPNDRKYTFSRGRVDPAHKRSNKHSR